MKSDNMVDIENGDRGWAQAAPAHVAGGSELPGIFNRDLGAKSMKFLNTQNLQIDIPKTLKQLEQLSL